MATEYPTIDDESKQLITDWADSIIQSARQLMFDGEAYLLAVSGLPWYRQNGDAWGDESWWLETAQARYDRHRNSPYRWATDNLEILLRHFPSKYHDDARLLIKQWYEEYSGHDPENWWELAMTVYPEHPILQDLHEQPENDEQLAILANLGYEDVIVQLHDELLSYFEDKDWYWGISIPSWTARIGGNPLLSSIASEGELQMMRQAIVALAGRVLPDNSVFRTIGERRNSAIRLSSGCTDTGLARWD